MKDPASSNGRGGFTLIETVITVVIFAFLIGGLAGVFVYFSNLQRYELALSGTAGDAGRLVQAVTLDVLPASHVLSSHAFAAGTYSSGTGTLVLEIPSVNAAGAIVSNTYDYVVVYVTGSTAYRRLEAGSGSARRAGLFTLGTRINSLSFTYDNATYSSVTKVTTDVVASTTAKGTTVSEHLTETARLRNH